MPAFYWNPTAPRDKKPATLSHNITCSRLVQSASASVPSAPAGNPYGNPASPAAPATSRFVVNFCKFLQWGRGAVGSAPRWHRGGRGFESHRLHQNFTALEARNTLAQGACPACPEPRGERSRRVSPGYAVFAPAVCWRAQCKKIPNAVRAAHALPRQIKGLLTEEIGSLE